MSRRARYRAERGRRRRLAEVDQRFGPDTSETVHRFRDHWTIRRPSDLVDMARWGVLMRNCFDPDRRNELTAMMEVAFGPYSSRALHVICDADGYPRAMFLHHDGASRDLEPNTPAYGQRLLDWHEARGLGVVDLGPSPTWAGV